MDKESIWIVRVDFPEGPEFLLVLCEPPDDVIPNVIEWLEKSGDLGPCAGIYPIRPKWYEGEDIAYLWGD